MADQSQAGVAAVREPMMAPAVSPGYGQPNTAKSSSGGGMAAAKQVAAALLAEFLGTLLLVLIAVGVQANEIKRSEEVLPNHTDLAYGPDYALTTALVFGITYMSLIVSIGRVSGGHFNPAITIAAMVSRRLGFIPSALYIACQLVGAIVGSAIYNGITGNKDYGQIGVIKLDTEFDSGSIFGIELLVTMFVTIVWFFQLDLATPPIGSYIDRSGPLYVGLAYAAGVMLTSRYDRGCLNPARAFGPAVIADEWEEHWMYFVGPLIGSASGTLVFELFVWLSPGARPETLLKEI